MKQRNSVFSLILICAMCLALLTGCHLFGGPDQPDDPVEYSITIDENIEHGSVQCELASAKAGETVPVTATADEDYVLVSITVNGEAIEGDSFVMPEEDVVIGATFALQPDLIEEASADAIKIKAQSAGGSSANGYFTIVFGENGISLKALIEDAAIVEKDGVAILFSRELPTIAGLLKNGETIKVSVNAKGEATILATDAEGVLAATDIEGVTTSFGTWSKKGEKLDGYHVEISVPYAALGVTADTAKGAVTVCPVIYSAYGSLPAQAATLEDVSEYAQNTFPVLVDDNTLRNNKYYMPSAQLGSFGSVIQGSYWDLTKDYYADDAENYPNREAQLTGHDANDNNIVFYRVSAKEMYVKATLTVTGVSNKNDQWPKFGLMLFDGASKKGVYFYVDAIMTGNTNNGVENIIGTDIGYNIAQGADYGAWTTAKSGAFDLNTKSIVMEMVYQDGWVHMYADGQFVRSIYYGAYNDNMHFGIKSFGIDLKVTDYVVSDDAEADGWADKKQDAKDAQTVDILFAGDSYMDCWKVDGMVNALSYTGATYANVGVGGTKVQYWIDKAPEMRILYIPSKIAFHISVNDIDDAGSDPAYVLEQLKVMFELYHEIYPDATIYWNSLVPNTMFPAKYDDYKVVNAGVLEYAGERDWLVYIDQTTSFDHNGAARQDVFGDGLHFNRDVGYPIWANNMLTAMGYERPDGITMGDFDRFSHTGLWEFGSDENGEYAYSFGNIDTSLWFKNVYGENVYVEATVSIGELRNMDGYPKFGLLVRNENAARWGFIDCFGYPGQYNTTAGLVSRGVDGIAQGNWNWDSTLWGSATGCDFGSVKLAIAKLDNTVYFLVNNVVYATAAFDGAVHVGYESFNLETTIRNVKSSTDPKEIERYLGISCQDAIIDGVADDAIWTDKVLDNMIVFGDKGDGRHLEFAAVKGSDGVYFLIDTYSFENTRSSANWWENANIEFRFNGVQQFIYVDGAGFNGVRTSGGITLSAVKALDKAGDLYVTRFEFFAPYTTFGVGSENNAEIPVNVFGWVWDYDSYPITGHFQPIMHDGGAHQGLNLTVSTLGARFARKVSVSGENAGISVDVQEIARVGDLIQATIIVAEGQQVDYVKVNGVEHTIVDGKINFEMPDEDVIIEVALKGISVSTEIKDLTGENYISANVNCETATAGIGETVNFTVDGYAADEVKLNVYVNGEEVAPVEGVYSYVVKATDTAVAIVVEVDYNLSEAIDGVNGGYGAPITMKVEGGRSFNVWAKTDAHGVYFYVEAVSATVVADAGDFWGNTNFEFRLNGAEHGGVNAKGEIFRASKGVYNYTQLDNGLYKSVIEVYVNEGWIDGFNAESVDLLYAFKTPGEWVWHENMVNNQWNRADWWRTGCSTPHGGEHVALGQPNGISDCIHITAAGIVHDCERASIDGDLSEYEGKNAFLGMGNDNAKFDFVGYVAEDGVYLGITIYQTNLGETRGEWWDTDNLEIKLLGDRAGFTIVEDFIAGCAPISDYALVRTYDETLGKHVTKIELFYAYDFSTAKQATFQVGVNGNGFAGWQGLVWDNNIACITENGIEWAVIFISNWEDAQRHAAEKLAAGEGIVLDGKADEAFYEGLTSITFDNVNGAKMVVTGRKLSTGIIVLNTITHTRPATDVIQGAGDAWWNFLDVEYRMGGNYSTQMATSVFNNGDWDQYCASKAVTVDNGDGTYTTTFETFLAFSTEYGGMDYDGEVQVCIGGVFETGFTWVAGCGPETPIYATERGFILK